MINFTTYNYDLWPAVIICLITGLLLTNCPWGRLALSSFANTRLDRCIVGILLGGLILVGWTKGPLQPRAHIAQFITALYSGAILDQSGLVATSTEQQTVAAFADLSLVIANAASQTVVNAGSDFAEVAALVTNSNRRVIYVQSSLPRTDPSQGIINHNISGFVVRTAMSEDLSTISRYVWYSAAPQVAPTVACVVDVGGGEIYLDAITNTFPATVEISGIPCIRYDYAVPAPLRHVVFFPDTEFTFGSPEKPLEVGIAGIAVDLGATTYLPFEGTDTLCTGRVSVVHSGGIATKIYIDGTPITNGVYTL